MLVMSLEDYDEVTEKAAKAHHDQRRGGQGSANHPGGSAEEGLLVSLNQRGTVDLEYIATLYGKPESQVIAELDDLIFRDPESKTWQTADAYLSGNVRAKLAAAEGCRPVLHPVTPTPCGPSSRKTYCGRHRRRAGSPVDTGQGHQAFAAESFKVRSVFRAGHPSAKGCRLAP